VFFFFLNELSGFLDIIRNDKIRIAAETLLNLLPAPFLYLYCLRVNDSSFRLSKIDFRYFTFIIISIAFFLIYLFGDLIIENHGSDLETIFRVYHTIGVLMISLQSYVFFALVTRMVSIKSGYNFFQTFRIFKIKDIRHQWLLFFIFMFFSHATIHLILLVAMNYNYTLFDKYVSVLNTILFLVVGMGSSFYFMLNPFILHINKWKTNYEDIDKYKRSGLIRDEAMKVLNQINTFMESEKLYLRKDLTMNQLAHEIGMPNHQISEVLNGILKQNFFDYVNNYRVEEVKQLLTQPTYKNYKMLDVAFDAGFSSRTTFNTVFKKVTGKTPSEYRRELDEKTGG
jgi:AraC-like DNA-binding protein